MAVVSKVSSALHHEEKDLELLNFDAKGLESVLNEEHYSSKQDDESSFSPTQRPCLNTQYTPIKTPASLHRLTTNPTTFPSTPSKTSACHNEADEVFKEATALKQTTKSTNRTDCLLKEGTEATTFVRSFVRQLYNSFGPYTTENQHRPIPSYNLLLALCLAGSAPALCLLLLPTLIFLVFALVALLPVIGTVATACCFRYFSILVRRRAYSFSTQKRKPIETASTTSPFSSATSPDTKLSSHLSTRTATPTQYYPLIPPTKEGVTQDTFKQQGNVYVYLCSRLKQMLSFSASLTHSLQIDPLAVFGFLIAFPLLCFLSIPMFSVLFLTSSISFILLTIMFPLFLLSTLPLSAVVAGAAIVPFLFSLPLSRFTQSVRISGKKLFGAAFNKGF